MEFLTRFLPIFVLWVSVFTSIRTVRCVPIAAQFRRAAATNNVQYYYYFDEEKGFFKGEEISNSVRMFNRIPAVLKRSSCSRTSRWLVEKFKDNEETNDPDNMIKHQRNVKHQGKSFFPLQITSRCADENITATIRDERHFQQFPLVVTYNSSKLTRIRVHTSDIFSEEQHLANKEIVWQIKNPTRSLFIRFSRFNMPEQPNCQNYVFLQDSEGNFLKICRRDQLQDHANNAIRLQGEKITIKFVTSNSTVAGTGFSAYVTIYKG